MDNLCNNVVSIISNSSAIILLIISEVLPFINSVKSNGLVEALYNNIKNKKISNDEEEQILHE